MGAARKEQYVTYFTSAFYMGNLWGSRRLEKYNRERYSILYINVYKREVEEVARGLEDTHGLQGSKKTLLSTGTNSRGCMQKMGAPTKCKGAQKEVADSAAVQVSSIATTKILIFGG